MTNRQPSPNRTGFTLVELLVTIGVIAILAGILVVALGNMGTKAREEATRAVIKKINGQMQERLEAFDRLKSQQLWKNKAIAEAANDSRVSGRVTTDAQREILGFKLLQMQLFPQTNNDLLSAEQNSNFSANPETESSELLYYALTSGKSLGVPTVDPGEYKTSEVSDTDGDGLLEFVDAWGRPLRFYRWPTRLISPNGTFDPQGRPTTIDRATAAILISGLPPAPTSSAMPDPLRIDQDDPTQLVQPTSDTVAATFEQILHTPQTWHQFLIVSAGQDSLKVGAGDDAFGLLSPSNRTNGGYLAQPKTGKFDAMTDNITNRNRP